MTQGTKDRASDDSRARPEDEERRDKDEQRDDGRNRRRLPGPDVIERAMQQLKGMTGKQAESISSFVADDDGSGWTLMFELVELERVPSTTNLMGTYEVDIDKDGNLLGFEQTRRYVKGQAGGNE
ncbi:MAG: gas vesicle protein [Actinomycetota bacterium]